MCIGDSSYLRNMIPKNKRFCKSCVIISTRGESMNTITLLLTSSQIERLYAAWSEFEVKAPA